MAGMLARDSEYFGRYRKLRPLASGGMAAVYVAEVEGAGGFSLPVALKVIHPHLVMQPEFVASFLDEARLGGMLRHPHIVKTLDCGLHEGVPFLAMELIPGPSLSSVLNLLRRRGQTLEPELALQLMVQVCRGLHAAHTATTPDKLPLNVVHRDLKPSNLLLDEHGIKITDFGIARASTNSQQTQYTGVIRGTYRYMSPEQAWGKRGITHQSDIFALGLILFECLTLEPLYRPSEAQYEVTEAMLLRMAQDADVEARLETLPDSPAFGQLEGILRKALQKDPARRYSSADELGDALDAARHLFGPPHSLSKWLQKMLEEPELRPPPAPMKLSHNVNMAELPSTSSVPKRHEAQEPGRPDGQDNGSDDDNTEMAGRPITRPPSLLPGVPPLGAGAASSQPPNEPAPTTQRLERSVTPQPEGGSSVAAPSALAQDFRRLMLSGSIVVLLAGGLIVARFFGSTEPVPSASSVLPEVAAPVVGASQPSEPSAPASAPNAAAPSTPASAAAGPAVSEAASVEASEATSGATTAPTSIPVAPGKGVADSGSKDAGKTTTGRTSNAGLASALKEKAAQEKAAQEKAAQEKAAQEKAAQEKAALEKVAQEKAAQARAERASAASAADSTGLLYINSAPEGAQVIVQGKKRVTPVEAWEVSAGHVVITVRFEDGVELTTQATLGSGQTLRCLGRKEQESLKCR